VATCNIAFSQENHIMCFLHVINISSTHIIEEFMNVSLIDYSAVFDPTLPPQDPDEQSYKKAIIHDPIALCCGTIHAI
jgi:hypothetical protein